MANVLSLALIRWLQRLCVVVTVGCCLYVAVFLVSSPRQPLVPENIPVVPAAKPEPWTIPTLSLMQSRPDGGSAASRDIFSPGGAAAVGGGFENTPKGQLPSHLKIVGIVIGHPSQIVIEDSAINKTYFIEEGRPEAGISIVKAGRVQMVIDYQGQDIPVAVGRPGQ